MQYPTLLYACIGKEKGTEAGPVGMVKGKGMVGGLVTSGVVIGKEKGTVGCTGPSCGELKPEFPDIDMGKEKGTVGIMVGGCETGRDET